MQQLLGEKASGTDALFLHELCSQQLSSNVLMVLASTNTTSLDELAQLANQIMEVATTSISNVSASSEVDQLWAEIADIKKLVQSLLIPQAQHQHRPSPSPSILNKESCWYHQRFGSSASKCQPSCNISGNTQDSN